MSQLDLWRRNWDPFRDLSPARNMDRFFDDFYTTRGLKGLEQAALSPSVEVHEAKNAYAVKFDLPGVQKDQIKIDLHDNTLTVSGERKSERREDDKDKKTYLSEVTYGAFSRTFTFPEGVDAEKADARFENGVLTLSVPKKETSGRRQISIK